MHETKRNRAIRDGVGQLDAGFVQRPTSHIAVNKEGDRRICFVVKLLRPVYENGNCFRYGLDSFCKNARLQNLVWINRFVRELIADRFAPCSERIQSNSSK